MDSTVASEQFLPSGKRIEDVHPPRRVRAVRTEDVPRFLAMSKRKAEKRKAAKGYIDDDPPLYKEDLEKAIEEQTKKYVAMALDHYNSTTEGPKYELVEAIGTIGIVSVGLWYHVCFTAKPISIGADTDIDASPKHFFAEVAYKVVGNEISCCIVDPKSPDTIDGCGYCGPNDKMYHPKGGFKVGDWPYAGDMKMHVSDNYYDASVPMERRINFASY